MPPSLTNEEEACNIKGSVTEKENAKAKKLERMLEQLEELKMQKIDKDENKTIALGTSKLIFLERF